MPSATGFLIATLLGSATRRLQVQLIGKSYPRAWNRVPGYALSSGFFVGVYLVIDSYVESNRKLLERKLAVLREQRALKDAFLEFDDEPDIRMTADKRGTFFKLFDKYGAPYK
ncbi:uncharacterized protein RJT21DRAFT_118602 [Scheffersomyces amazonensis]|uniref:uncharacterized protein n=1 Tax=Scheffersomyces amazonensis TaxID=1078765 RepID=UPI00315C8BA0